LLNQYQAVQRFAKLHVKILMTGAVMALKLAQDVPSALFQLLAKATTVASRASTVTKRPTVTHATISRRLWFATLLTTTAAALAFPLNVESMFVAQSWFQLSVKTRLRSARKALMRI
jgi:hypothetical protein